MGRSSKRRYIGATTRCYRCFKKIPAMQINRHLAHCVSEIGFNNVPVSHVQLMRPGLLHDSNIRNLRQNTAANFNDSNSISQLTSQSNFENRIHNSSEPLVQPVFAVRNNDMTDVNDFFFMNDDVLSSNNDMSESSSNGEFDSMIPFTDGIANVDNDYLCSNNNILNGNIFIPPHSPMFQRITNPTLLAHMEIYDILYRAKAPLYVHNSIIKCIMRNIDKGAFEYNHNDYSRKTFLKTICRKYATANPTVVPVHLENRWNKDANEPQNLDRDTVEVICFDFKKQVEDILADTELFGDERNLVINKSLDDSSKKWLPYEKVGDSLFEVFDGEWYQRYAKKW